MENNDILSEVRSLLTQLREQLIEYENRWNIESNEYRSSTEGNITQTFGKLIRTSKRLLLNIEHLYIHNLALEDRVNILQRVLESLITDPKVKQNYQNDLEIGRKLMNHK